VNLSFNYSRKALLWGAFLSCGFFSTPLWAWGGRGHHAICEAATFLVTNAELKSFLAGMGPRMGHLCNVPDTLWRSLDESQTRLGNPAHFINPENVNKTLAQLPTDYSKSVNKGDIEAATKLGGIWWRAKQFFELALVEARRASRSEAPKNVIEEQNAVLPYNEAIYKMLMHMGLMGHFVGDVSMPFHNRRDYDGRATGHGGIHAFYEETCVNLLGADLTERVRVRAEAIADKQLLPSKIDVLRVMKAMSEKAEPEAAQIETLDVVVAPSSTDRRTAQRRPAAEACPVFHPMILEQMGRSARVLAMFWDEIFRRGGYPKLGAYRSYRYPFQPEFVAPDYF